MHLAATFKTCARNTIANSLSPTRKPSPPPLLPPLPAELHPSCRAAYHYHANTLGVRQSPCKIAHLFTSYPASPTLVFISLPRNVGSLFHLPTPTPCPLSTRDSTSHQLPSHICKTCHYYNNITPMNLPLNMRSAIVDCIANYLPGGVIRTGFARSPFRT